MIGKGDCFKCGDSGHWARDCRKEDDRPWLSRSFVGRGRGSLASQEKCYKCSRPGHFARECRVEADRCYKCNQLGHLSKDCKIDIGQGACYNCKGTDHIQKDCPQGNTRACYKCSDTGHLARDCPKNSPRVEERTCYQCGKSGHLARDCSEPPRSPRHGSPAPRGGNDNKNCYNCGQSGHIVRDCREPNNGFRPRSGMATDVKCYTCGGVGHISKECATAAKQGKECFRNTYELLRVRDTDKDVRDSGHGPVRRERMERPSFSPYRSSSNSVSRSGGRTAVPVWN